MSRTCNINSISELEAFPPLPSELVWQICRFAATDYSTALSIALVSKALQRVVDPIIYVHYSISAYSDFKRFFHILEENRVSNRRLISDHIRTLYLEFAYVKLDEVVRACTQIQRLAIYVWSAPIDINPPLPAPTEICILYDTAVVDLRSPLFRAVTRLNIGRAPPSLDDIAIIGSYPNLTHFGFHFRDKTESVDETTEIVGQLLEWAHLKAICVEVSKGNALPDHDRTARIWSRLSVYDDPRLLVIPASPVPTPDELRRRFLSGHSLWDRLRTEALLCS